MSNKKLGIVVPHTHWDRAWYLPFQAYRLRLVEMMDDLLRWLESGALPLFVLDGQTVLLEDYFAVRPHDKSRVRALVESGKIKVGPWYTMPDCFLARPESLIRNLQRGLHMAEELGGASRIGYVPDSFGHFAQLPQILAGFKIDSFLFMRGMPESLRDEQGAVFHWQAPDGSQVLATYLREGYFPLGALGQESFHGRYDGLVAQPDLARQRLSDTLARLRPFQKDSVMLLPAGGDHLPARDDLTSLVAQLNESDPEVELRIGSFEEYLQELRCAAPEKQRGVHCGDLLGQADHPLLRNVLSSRVDLKILNHQAQSLLTGIVEPLIAWSRVHQLQCVDPALLQIAWDALLKNHAHDDICGCSVDDVHIDDVQRFHEVIALSQEMITRQIEHIAQCRLNSADNPRSSRVFVFNPHPWSVQIKRSVTILLADEGGEFSPPSEARVLKAINAAGVAVPVQILSTRCKAIRNRYLETTWGRAYDVQFEMMVPPLGFEIVIFSESSEALKLCAEASIAKVPEDLLQAFRLEWDADLGDGYSFGPCPELPAQVARLSTVRADDQIAGVYHLTFELSAPAWIRRDELAHHPLSACVGPHVTMNIDVRAQRRGGGENAWELKISYTNVLSDSRLRLLVDPNRISFTQGLGPCREILSHGQAQWVSHPAQATQQDIWDGPLAKPAYPGEKNYPVHHTNDGVVWACAQQCAFLGGVGLHEFEIVKSVSDNKSSAVQLSENAPTVALTLHRAVGFLSVRGGRIRSCQAGPQRPTPDAQLQKHIEHRVTFGCAASPLDAFRALKEALNPCWIQEVPMVPVRAVALSAMKDGKGKDEHNLQNRPSALSASLGHVGDSPLEIMCLKPSEKGFIVRFVNPTPQNIDAEICFSENLQYRLKAVRTLLDDRNPIGTSILLLQNNLKTKFNPFEIQTWKIEPC